MRYGYSGHFTAVQIRTSDGWLQQQSKHFARIAFTGVKCIRIPPLWILAVFPCCLRLFVFVVGVTTSGVEIGSPVLYVYMIHEKVFLVNT